MIIANPIFDVVFKRLMEDERIAKFFIGTLLNEIIDEVEVKPQEFTYTDQLYAIAVFRVDFIATIKTSNGALKKVLIEIQKAKNQIDLMRFRNYLAEQYKKEDNIETETGKKKIALPIVTIYLLGFSLTEVESSAVRVQRNYIDLNTNKIIEKKSDFIEKLTHDCFVVQLPRIQQKYLTSLDKLLSVFEQTNFVDEKKIIKSFDHEIDESGVKNMTDVLHFIGTDPEEKKLIENEQEAWRTLDALTEGFREKALELQEVIKTNRKEIEDKVKVIEDKEKEIEDKVKVIEDKEKALVEQKKIIEELRRRLGD